jgi:hypothetical protein
LLSELRRIEAGAEGETLFWKDGEVTLVPRDDNPRHQTAAGTAPPRADFAALDPDRLDNLNRFTGYWWNTYHVPPTGGEGLLRFA